MDTRTYRRCVRIVIVKGKQVLLGKKYIDNKFIGYEFPGGGIEDKDSEVETVIKEALEEVGILVKNPVNLHLRYRYDIDYSKPERAKLFKGGEDIWYMAEFAKKDDTLHGIENDKLPYTWESVDSAIEKIKRGPQSRFNAARIEALKSVEIYISKRPSLESW